MVGDSISDDHHLISDSEIDFSWAKRFEISQEGEECAISS